MARIRTVKPDLFAHPKMAKVPIEARYLFVGLLTQADDEGRLWDSPRALCGAVFPHDPKVSERMVEKWLTDLAGVESIVRYQVKGVAYIAIPAWSDHQRVSHPRASIFPRYSGEIPEEGRNGSGPIPEIVQ
jgi:hypothetical protein